MPWSVSKCLDGGAAFAFAHVAQSSPERLCVGLALATRALGFRRLAATALLVLVDVLGEALGGDLVEQVQGVAAIGTPLVLACSW